MLQNDGSLWARSRTRHQTEDGSGVNLSITALTAKDVTHAFPLGWQRPRKGRRRG